MSKRAIILLAAGTIVVAAMIIPPLMLWGDKSKTVSTQQQSDDPNGDVIVYCSAVPEGLHFGDLAPALTEINSRFAVASAVAATAVYGESVIIAKNRTQWRTIPEGALFLLDAPTHGAKVFLNDAEFALYLTKHPELARAGVRAMVMNEFLHLLFDVKTGSTEKPL